MEEYTLAAYTTERCPKCNQLFKEGDNIRMSYIGPLHKTTNRPSDTELWLADDDSQVGVIHADC